MSQRSDWLGECAWCGVEVPMDHQCPEHVASEDLDDWYEPSYVQ